MKHGYCVSCLLLTSVQDGGVEVGQRLGDLDADVQHLRRQRAGRVRGTKQAQQSIPAIESKHITGIRTEVAGYGGESADLYEQTRMGYGACRNHAQGPRPACNPSLVQRPLRDALSPCRCPAAGLVSPRGSAPGRCPCAPAPAWAGEACEHRQGRVWLSCALQHVVGSPPVPAQTPKAARTALPAPAHASGVWIQANGSL